MPGSTRSYEFAKALIEMGHKVEIITSYRDFRPSKKWFQTEYSGIKIHWLPLIYSNYTSYFRRITIFFVFAFKAYVKIKKIKGDIIYASSTPLSAGIPAILTSIKNQIPMIFEVRDLWPDVPIAMKILKNPIIIFFAKMLEKVLYKISCSIVALSPEMKDGIIKKKIDSKKIATIPNSSDLEKFRFNEKLAFNFRNERTWLKEKPLLLYSGAFGKVIEDAKKNNVYEKNLFFEKLSPKKDMPAYFSAATIVANFVIDIRENWANSANKFFDGLAAGKPIFLNHGGWMKDLVSKYNCGLCMYGKKINEVAKELDLAISNKAWLKSSGESSRKLAENFFNRKTHVEQLEKVFHLAVNNKSKMTYEVTKDFYQ
jgi:glycosyltransferase involved in cell wall biosynthesis